MTFTYDIATDGSSMDVVDHTGTVVRTLSNDGGGFRLPQDVCDVMREEAEKARSNGNMSRWRDIHIRLASNDISEA